MGTLKIWTVILLFLVGARVEGLAQLRPAYRSEKLVFARHGYGLLVAAPGSVAAVERFKATIPARGALPEWLTCEDGNRYLIETALSRYAPLGVLKIYTTSPVSPHLVPDVKPISGRIEAATAPDDYPNSESEEIGRMEKLFQVVANYEGADHWAGVLKRYDDYHRESGYTIPDFQVDSVPLKITTVGDGIKTSLTDVVPAELIEKSPPSLDLHLPIGNFNYPAGSEQLNFYDLQAGVQLIDVFRWAESRVTAPVVAVEVHTRSGFTGNVKARGTTYLAIPPGGRLRGPLVAVTIRGAPTIPFLAAERFEESAFAGDEIIILEGEK